MMPVCNICGATRFIDRRHRKASQCAGCNSLERTRVMMLHLQRLGLPRPGTRVLHFAPEVGLARYLRDRVGSENYHARDFNPSRYRSVPEVRKFDLCSDSFNLEADHYDLVLHSHVMEHIPCSYAVVLYNLQKALHPDGYHICSIPILRGRYDETTQPIGKDEATRRFGQHDHVRRFGVEDLQSSLGMVFHLPEHYDLTETFSIEELRAAGVPEYAWRGYTPHSVLVLRKSSLRLQ